MAYSSFVFYPRWQQQHTQATIAYDVEGYYYYLPSIFIYKDIKKFSFKDSIMDKYQASGTGVFQHGFKDEKSGNYILKYSCGMALMYLPAFVAAHSIVSFTGFPADGFSIPYQLSLQIWGLLFTLIGLYYLRKLLKYYYSDTVVSIVLLLLVLGTNYLNYATIDVGMSHSWLFTLYVFLLLNTHYFYQTLSAKFAIRSGFIIGLLVLIRPTEIIACLIPLLWGVESLSDLKNRFKLLIRNNKTVAVAALGLFSVVFIQLFYWHYVSGQWIVYSYRDQGFNFLRPHAFMYSWSYRAGWLRYSPMMLLCFVGFLIYAWRGKNKFAVMIFFALNYYIVSAWNVWDYGGFSGRAMIQSYPVLLFAMASFIELTIQKKYLALVATPVIILFVYINIWWTYQAHTAGGLVDSNCTTKEYYWKMVGRWSLPEMFFKLKDTNELPEFEPQVLNLIYSDTSSAHSCVDKETQDQHFAAISLANTQENEWIRVAADFHAYQKEWDVWKMPQFIVQLKSGSQIIKTRMIRTHRFLNDNEKRNLFIDIRIPNQKADSIVVSYWNAEGDKKNCLSKLTFYSFKA
jgi:hypothetical protein